MYKRAKSLVMLNLLVILSLRPGGSQARPSRRGPQEDLRRRRWNRIPRTTQPKLADGTLMVPVIVKLEDESLASYRGGVAGLEPTSPAVTGEKRLDTRSLRSQAYLKYLSQKQNDFAAAAAAAIPGATVTYKFDVVLNAVAMTVPASKVDELAALPGVVAVYPDELRYIQTDNSPQFIGAPTVWAQLGGQESAGEGVIVGVLDTGIWPEHPSFSDPDPSGKPYAAPPPAPSGSPGRASSPAAPTPARPSPATTS